MLSFGRCRSCSKAAHLQVFRPCTNSRNIHSHGTNPEPECVDRASKDPASGDPSRPIAIATAHLAAPTPRFCPSTTITTTTSFSKPTFTPSSSRNLLRIRSSIIRRPSSIDSSALGRAFFSTSSAVMAAQKIDGTAIAKSIRGRLQVEIQERKQANPKYIPSLKIIQGVCLYSEIAAFELRPLLTSSL